MQPSRKYQITFADALTKISWGTAKWGRDIPQETRTFRVQALRNEVTGFQVIVTADQDFVLTTGAANWLHPLGFLPRLRLEVKMDGLPEDVMDIFTVGYVEGDDRRQWMETLERSGWAEASAGKPQAVYIRLRIPQDAVPGSHYGTVRAFRQQGFGDETLEWEGAVELDIAAPALPDASDYSFHLNLWQHLTALSRYYRVPLWGDEHFVIIDRYFASLARLGQKVVSLVVSEMPWSGQRCYRDTGYPSYLFEHALVHVNRTEDGALRFDFSTLDRVLKTASTHGMDRTIDVFGLVNIWLDEEMGFGKVAEDAPDAIRVRCYEEASGTYRYLRTAEELKVFIRALHDHFAKLGVLDRVRVAADEPADLEKFRRSVAFVREAGPGFQYSAAINHFEFLDDAPEGVIDFIPVLPLACRDTALTARLTERLHEQGGKMLWYVCCWPPYPNTFLHSPLAEGRLHGWLTWALHLDGFLRWAFCLWPANPWERVSWRAPDWNAGDMYFVLPGSDGAPVETLRYEALRSAVQDYELIRLVERSLGAEDARAVISAAFGHILRASSLESFATPEPGKAESLYSTNLADYHSARARLIQALEERLSRESAA